MAMNKEDKKTMIVAMISYPLIHIAVSDFLRKRRSKRSGRGDEESEIDVVGDAQG